MRKIESNEGQEDTEIENESKSSTFQNANQHSTATALAKNYDPVPGDEEVAAPVT